MIARSASEARLKYCQRRILTRVSGREKRDVLTTLKNERKEASLIFKKTKVTRKYEITWDVFLPGRMEVNCVFPGSASPALRRRGMRMAAAQNIKLHINSAS